MISPVTPHPSTVHYQVMWSLFFGWQDGKWRGVWGAEKSLSLKGESEGRGILRVYASREGVGLCMVYKWGWREKEGRVPLPSTHLSCHTPFSHP